MQFIKADTDRTCMRLGGIEAFAVADGMIWGALVSLNALVRIPMDTWKVQFIAEFPEENSDGFRLFGGAVYYREKLIFCPMRAQNIVVYDIAQKSFLSIPLDMELVRNNKVYKKNYKTEDVVLYNDFAYIVGCSYPAIIRISLQDMSVKYITEPFKELDKRIVDYSNGYFDCVTRQNNDLYAGCCLSGDILKFSLEDETYEIISTDFKGINAVIETKDKLLLTSLTDHKGYEVKNGGNYCRHVENLNDVLIVKTIFDMKSVYLFCFKCGEKKKLLRYDLIKDKVEAVADIEEGFYNAVKFGNRIFAAFLTSGKIIEINMEKGTIEEHVLTYSGTILRWLMKEKKVVVIEKEKNELKKYLEWIAQMGEI